VHNPSAFDLYVSDGDRCDYADHKVYGAITTNDKLELCDQLVSPNGDTVASLIGIISYVYTMW
jgi:hypothetical protein